MEQEILFESPHGIQFIYIKQKRRARIDVRNNNYNFTHLTYKFNNIPLFQHPFLSWENLNCCGDWPYNESYLFDAVQKHRKLVSCIGLYFTDTSNIAKWIDDYKHDYKYNKEEIDLSIDIKPKRNYFGQSLLDLTVARKGCLHDFFNLDEILFLYRSHSVSLTDDDIIRINNLFHVPLISLYTKEGIEKYNFDYGIPRSSGEFVVNGLALGYPVESTVGVIKA